jgi:3-methylcrotonyl-CoA carboxylase alpha subunit
VEWAWEPDELMAGGPTVKKVAPGTYQVESAGMRETVYVAGPPHDRWAFWNGRIFRSSGDSPLAGQTRAAGRPSALQALSAPMPATVIKVLVKPGTTVEKGDVVAILEAMKMELPIRSPSNGIVKAVYCREGELVQADQTLVELE